MPNNLFLVAVPFYILIPSQTCLITDRVGEKTLHCVIWARSFWDESEAREVETRIWITPVSLTHKMAGDKEEMGPDFFLVSRTEITE